MVSNVICLVAPVAALAQSATLITTFTNPTPADNDFFGSSVAALGNDRVLIGAYSDDSHGRVNVGVAYLFSANGTLLTTFTNPTPSDFDNFGHQVAALGNDRVLVSAPWDDSGALNAGAVYLFATNGTLLTTFTNPTPAQEDLFGSRIAAVGDGRILIGAYVDDTGAANAGAVYLFSTDGTLVNTFTNPTPVTEDHFGLSVAALGIDRVLIGAPTDNTGELNAGAAYLFTTNATLLTTFTNPAPAMNAYFGQSVAAMEPDRVLIGAPNDFPGSALAGAAYLFSTNGALLTTFTNPAGTNGDSFGYSVAVVSNNKVLVGAYQDDTGATNVGVAYLFNTNGTLLTSFTHPTPAADDRFGFSVAVLGGDHVLVGAYYDDTGATNAGTAYLFSIQQASAPLLSIRLTVSNSVAISWPSPSSGFTLQQNTDGVNWSNVTDAIQNDGTNKMLVVNPTEESRFYRLILP